MATFLSLLVLAVASVSAVDARPTCTSDKLLKLQVAAIGLSAQVTKAVGQNKGDKDGPPDREKLQILEQAEQLAGQGPKGVLALGEKLKGDSRAWKSAALHNLLDLGPEAAPALDAIIQELSAKESEFTTICLEVLAAIGPKAKPALPAIMAAAKDTSDFQGSFRLGGPSNTAEAALRAVEAIDPSSTARLAETMLPSLIKVVESGRESPMHNALALLRELGPHARPALPKLRDTIAAMPSNMLRNVFPIFLAAGEDGMTLLADYMLDPKTSSETRVALMTGYEWEHKTTPSTIRILRALLKDKSPEARASALQALKSVRAKELIPDLIPLLSDRDIIKVVPDFIFDDPYYAARALGN
jgi:hypothetical protein